MNSEQHRRLSRTLAGIVIAILLAPIIFVLVVFTVAAIWKLGLLAAAFVGWL